MVLNLISRSCLSIVVVGAVLLCARLRFFPIIYNKNVNRKGSFQRHPWRFPFLKDSNGGKTGQSKSTDNPGYIGLEHTSKNKISTIHSYVKSIFSEDAEGENSNAISLLKRNEHRKNYKSGTSSFEEKDDHNTNFVLADDARERYIENPYNDNNNAFSHYNKTNSLIVDQAFNDDTEEHATSAHNGVVTDEDFFRGDDNYNLNGEVGKIHDAPENTSSDTGTSRSSKNPVATTNDDDLFQDVILHNDYEYDFEGDEWNDYEQDTDDLPFSYSEEQGERQTQQRNLWSPNLRINFRHSKNYQYGSSRATRPPFPSPPRQQTRSSISPRNPPNAWNRSPPNPRNQSPPNPRNQSPPNLRNRSPPQTYATYRYTTQGPYINSIQNAEPARRGRQYQPQPPATRSWWDIWSGMNSQNNMIRIPLRDIDLNDDDRVFIPLKPSPSPAPTSASPTRTPTRRPTHRPTIEPTRRPTHTPTTRPTPRPTRTPTRRPTHRPTIQPTRRPTRTPTLRPTRRPTRSPTRRPTRRPTLTPTRRPTRFPTRAPVNPSISLSIVANAALTYEATISQVDAAYVQAVQNMARFPIDNGRTSQRTTVVAETTRVACTTLGSYPFSSTAEGGCVKTQLNFFTNEGEDIFSLRNRVRDAIENQSFKFEINLTGIIRTITVELLGYNPSPVPAPSPTTSYTLTMNTALASQVSTSEANAAFLRASESILQFNFNSGSSGSRTTFSSDSSRVDCDTLASYPFSQSTDGGCLRSVLTFSTNEGENVLSFRDRIKSEVTNGGFTFEVNQGGLIDAIVCELPASTSTYTLTMNTALASQVTLSEANEAFLRASESILQFSFDTETGGSRTTFFSDSSRVDCDTLASYPFSQSTDGGCLRSVLRFTTNEGESVLSFRNRIRSEVTNGGFTFEVNQGGLIDAIVCELPGYNPPPVPAPSPTTSYTLTMNTALASQVSLSEANAAFLRASESILQFNFNSGSSGSRTTFSSDSSRVDCVTLASYPFSQSTDGGCLRSVLTFSTNEGEDILSFRNRIRSEVTNGGFTFEVNQGGLIDAIVCELPGYNPPPVPAPSPTTSYTLTMNTALASQVSLSEANAAFLGASESILQFNFNSGSSGSRTTFSSDSSRVDCDTLASYPFSQSTDGGCLRSVLTFSTNEGEDILSFRNRIRSEVTNGGFTFEVNQGGLIDAIVCELPASTSTYTLTMNTALASQVTLSEANEAFLRASESILQFSFDTETGGSRTTFFSDSSRVDCDTLASYPFSQSTDGGCLRSVLRFTTNEGESVLSFRERIVSEVRSGGFTLEVNQGGLIDAIVCELPASTSTYTLTMNTALASQVSLSEANEAFRRASESILQFSFDTETGGSRTTFSSDSSRLDCDTLASYPFSQSADGGCLRSVLRFTTNEGESVLSFRERIVSEVRSGGFTLEVNQGGLIDAIVCELPATKPSPISSFAPSTSPSEIPSNDPSVEPSIFPSKEPSFSPSLHPSVVPSSFPSVAPSDVPSLKPSVIHSSLPSRSAVPSGSPSAVPSIMPSFSPSLSSLPSLHPSPQPSTSPSASPSQSQKPSFDGQTYAPTASPSSGPSLIPSTNPSFSPSSQPSNSPSASPSHSQKPSFDGQTYAPTASPSSGPSSLPSSFPSQSPSAIPTTIPSTTSVTNAAFFQGTQSTQVEVAYFTVISSTLSSRRMLQTGLVDVEALQRACTFEAPLDLSDEVCYEVKVVITAPVYTGVNTEEAISNMESSVQDGSFATKLEEQGLLGAFVALPPSQEPSSKPSAFPSISMKPSVMASNQPSMSGSPSVAQSSEPSLSFQPSSQPTSMRSSTPSLIPSTVPSATPSISTKPSIVLSSQPTVSLKPSASAMPSSIFSAAPSTSERPSVVPSSQHSIQPSASVKPSTQPSVMPSLNPSAVPSMAPSISAKPSTMGSSQPSLSLRPSSQPSLMPSVNPSSNPSSVQSIAPSISAKPSTMGSSQPSVSLRPSSQPSLMLSVNPSSNPSSVPSIAPSISAKPSTMGSSQPSVSLRPSSQPSLMPSVNPSSNPSSVPSIAPSISAKPSPMGSSQPSLSNGPSTAPSSQPSLMPSVSPSSNPSSVPSIAPSISAKPSPMGSSQPSLSNGPSTAPSSQPSFMHSVNPSSKPSSVPSIAPSSISAKPSSMPSSQPSLSNGPSTAPSSQPSFMHSVNPSSNPSSVPSIAPSISAKPSPMGSSQPSLSNGPSTAPSSQPSLMPSVDPSSNPSSVPSMAPSISAKPSSMPSSQPSLSNGPSTAPSSNPSSVPSIAPSISAKPSPMGSSQPSLSNGPSTAPSSQPSLMPSVDPSSNPSSGPSIAPSISAKPSSMPSSQPSLSNGPSTAPSSQPSFMHSVNPSSKPSSVPSIAPSSISAKPSSMPSSQPSLSNGPSIAPSSQPSLSHRPSNAPSVVPSLSEETSSETTELEKVLEQLSQLLSDLQSQLNSQR